MPEFDPIEERLPEGVRQPPKCPPLNLLLAHQEGVLPEEVTTEVGRHLEHCGLCRTLLADIKELAPPGLSERERELMRARMPIPSAVDSSRWRWYAVLGAVAAALVVAAFLGLRTRNVQPVQTVQVTPPSIPPKQEPQPQVEVAKLAPPLDVAPGLVLRGGGASDRPGPEELAPAFEAYGKGDYVIASERFDLLAKQFPRAEVPVLYLGVSQLLMRDDQSALASLSRADKLAEGERKDTAAWYHAVAAVLTHSPQAHELVAELCRRDKSEYARQACDLKKKL